MNKTVVSSVAIVMAGLFGMLVFFMLRWERIVATTLVDKRSTADAKMETRDRFTVCVQTVMAEARHSGKPIEAADAKEICVHVKDV